MRLIDSTWIKNRLTGEYGEKAALARALGVHAIAISQILNGTRQIKPEEMEKLERFFDEKQWGEQLHDRVHRQLQRLSYEEMRYVLYFIEGLPSVSERHDCINEHNEKVRKKRID